MILNIHFMSPNQFKPNLKHILRGWHKSSCMVVWALFFFRILFISFNEENHQMWNICSLSCNLMLCKSLKISNIISYKTTKVLILFQTNNSCTGRVDRVAWGLGVTLLRIAIKLLCTKNWKTFNFKTLNIKVSLRN